MITLLTFHQVTAHHEQLLIQAAGVTNLDGSLHAVRSSLSELDASLEKYSIANLRTWCLLNVSDLCTQAEIEDSRSLSVSTGTC